MKMASHVAIGFYFLIIRKTICRGVADYSTCDLIHKSF